MRIAVLSHVVLLLALSAPSLAWGASEAEVRMRAGDVAGALPLARQQAASRPDDLDAQELYIDLGLGLGLRHHVEALYRDRVADNPNDADAHYLLGRVVPSPDEALEAYNKTLELSPEHARAPMGIGAVKRATGDLPGAIDSYKTALQRDPTLVEAWSGLQAALLQAGRIGEAQQTARRFLQAIPDEPDPYIAVATLEQDRALEVLAVGVKRVPDDPRLHALYARTLLDDGQAGPALAQVRTALQRAPSYAEVQFLGMVAREMQAGVLDVDGWRALGKAQNMTDGAQARAAWANLTQRYPRSALTWLGLGKVLGALGDMQGAIAPLRKASELSPDEVEVQATYGLALLRTGRHAQALPWLERASAGRPRDASLALARVQAVQGSGDAQAARTLAVQAYKDHPHDLEVALVTARILSEGGDRRGAYIALRDALPRIPDPRLVIALAAAARDAGYYLEAAEILDRLGRTLDNDKARALSRQLRQEAQAAGQLPKDEE